ncbi:MAG: ABC transporter transmembrane domain-containing protein, partial [Clostridium sp.]|nr:ABC transporter transmembrane domain-containing protein [Clostridium sp.]
MFKLIKYLKKSAMAILVIIALLVVQALCDLALPDYTSKIVNVGIQQGGVENAVPEVIRKSEMDKVLLFMSSEDKDKVLDNYKLVEKDNLTEEDKENYSKLDEDIYKLNTKDEDKIEELNQILGKPILTVSGLENDSDETKAMKEEMMSNLPPQMAEGGNVDIFQVFSMMPEEQFKQVKDKIDEQFSEMPDSIISQAAISYVKGEYETIGIDVDKVQINYILMSGAKMLGIALLGAVVAIIVGFIASKVAAKTSMELRSNIFKKVMSFSNSEMDKFSTASLITRSTNDIQQIQMVIVMLL